MEGKFLRNALEAALFMSPGIISLHELARIGETNVAEARVALNELMHEYAERDAALVITEEETGIRMKVRPELEDKVSHLANIPSFHQGVLKTLAYIAYKQPVTQAQVIHFRNSKAYEHIKILKEKGFLRKEKAGITYKLYTTKKFYDYFGKSLAPKQPGQSDEQATAQFAQAAGGAPEPAEEAQQAGAQQEPPQAPPAQQSQEPPSKPASENQ